MTDKHFQEVSSIIDGITKRCGYKVPFLSTDDIAQELWLSVLKKERQQGCALDLDLVAFICYCRIKDLYNYEARRVHQELDETSYEKSSSDEGKVSILVLLGEYSETTEEGMLLRYWCHKANLIDYCVETENALAEHMGYGQASHRAYKRLKKKMKKTVSDFFEKNG